MRRPARCRRARRIIASAVEPAEEPLFDDLVSDDTHIVVDSADVAHLVEQMQLAGLDNIESSHDSEVAFQEDFLTLAERRADEAKGVKSDVGDSSKNVHTNRGSSERVMNYFTDDHVEFMPRWAREAFHDNLHEELEKGAQRLVPITSQSRLHDIVMRRKSVTGDVENVRGDGIVDCTVIDVADDYSVPVEFIVDAMLAIGVPLPISAESSVRDSMTSEEIQRLLKLLTSFDAVDLAERYSDRTLVELAEDYDVDVDVLVSTCEKEGLYLCAGHHTRLSVVREDRVLDILLRGANHGKPYPDLLDGLG